MEKSLYMLYLKSKDLSTAVERTELGGGDWRIVRIKQKPVLSTGAKRNGEIFRYVESKVERSLHCGREDGTWWKCNNFKEKKIVLSTEAKRNGEIFLHALRKVERSLRCGREDVTWWRGLENRKEKAQTRPFD